MDNEILGKMIIKTTYMKYRDNNTQEGFAEIILIEKSGVFEQYHGEMNIYIFYQQMLNSKKKGIINVIINTILKKIIKIKRHMLL